MPEDIVDATVRAGTAAFQLLRFQVTQSVDQAQVRPEVVVQEFIGCQVGRGDGWVSFGYGLVLSSRIIMKKPEYKGMKKPDSS